MCRNYAATPHRSHNQNARQHENKKHLGTTRTASTATANEWYFGSALAVANADPTPE
jgi:hypothetical protein